MALIDKVLQETHEEEQLHYFHWFCFYEMIMAAVMQRITDLAVVSWQRRENLERDERSCVVLSVYFEFIQHVGGNVLQQSK